MALFNIRLYLRMMRRKCFSPFGQGSEWLCYVGSAGILVLKNRHAKLEVQKSTRIAASAQTAMPPILRSDPEGMWVAKAIELALNDQA